MKSFNRVILIGNIVHDPALRGDPAAPLCTFSIAVNEPKRTESGAWTTEAHYFDVTCFGQTAEAVARHKKKGDPVLVEGKLAQSRLDDKTTGQKRQKVSILAREVIFLPRGTSSNRSDPSDRSDASGVPHNVGDVFPEAQPVDEDQI